MFITTSMVDHDEEKRTEQNLIVRIRKSEAELARSTYCTIEATDRHEASRGLSATAGLLAYFCFIAAVQTHLNSSTSTTDSVRPTFLWSQ